jgi:serine/threonine-protein kinase
MTTCTQVSFTGRLVTSRLLSVEQLAQAQAAVNHDESRLPDYLLGQGLLTPFQVRQLRAGATGFNVGKYVVEDCLGRGGNGVVYKARHTLMPNRFVALKTVDNRNLHNGDDIFRRFRREIDILAGFEHPNIVRAYDVLQTRKELFLVLEYIAGRDLATLVKERGPLPAGEAVDYAIQAARGLAYAHRCRVVHRDLKPANLLLTPEGVVKITDLGLARVRLDQPDTGMTMRGMCIGTPEFMAPEQAEDSSGADERSDLFSLGATLFHLLTGQLHVVGNSYHHRLKHLLLVPPRPLADARADVPVGLAAVVDRLRARERAARPQSADEAIALLKPFGQPRQGARPGPWDARRKAALVLEVFQGKLTAAEACERHSLAAAEFEHWRQRFLEGAEKALDPAGPPAVNPQMIRDLHAQIGAQAMELQALKKQLSE